MTSNHQQSPQLPLSLKSFQLSKFMEVTNTYLAVNQNSFSSRNGGFQCFKTCQFTTVWIIILNKYHGLLFFSNYLNHVLLYS